MKTINDKEENNNIREEALIDALQCEFNSAPWYLGSIGIHLIIFLILLLIPISTPPPDRHKIYILTEMMVNEDLEIPEKIIDEKEVDPNIVENINDSAINDESIIINTNIEISDQIETDDNMDDNSALGDKDNISDVDSEYVGIPALMGVGASGGSGGGGRFGGRLGGRRTTLRINGGSPQTEKSVESALRWLAEHQEEDGRWSCKKYGGKEFDIAVTSLSCLAFLGSGNSTKFGKYKKNVSASVSWLVKNQDPTGRIGPHRYEAALSLMAISEAYGMSSDNKIKTNAQKSVDWAIKSQCPSGGWDYTPKSLRVDTSVSGWWIMGLKSAKISDLSFPEETMKVALKYIQNATTDQGSVSYVTENAPDLNSVKSGGGSNRMTTVALTTLQFLGVQRNDKKLIELAKATIRDGVPSPEKYDFYRWYYASLGLFQMGIRSDYWKSWNEPLKESLLSTQVNIGTYQENKGSWNFEIDPYGVEWGRVGQTALGALMLEVYYRYEDVHHTKQ
jgi:hypothetical protein